MDSPQLENRFKGTLKCNSLKCNRLKGKPLEDNRLKVSLKVNLKSIFKDNCKTRFSMVSAWESKKWPTGISFPKVSSKTQLKTKAQEDKMISHHHHGRYKILGGRVVWQLLSTKKSLSGEYTSSDIVTFDPAKWKFYYKMPRPSSVGQSAGLSIPSSVVRFRQKLKKPRTQIYMDLRYVDPQARVLNYCFK